MPDKAIENIRQLLISVSLASIFIDILPENGYNFVFIGDRPYRALPFVQWRTLFYYIIQPLHMVFLQKNVSIFL